MTDPTIPQPFGQPCHVGIVGAGFTGSLCAVHLLHRLPPGSRVTLLDRTGSFGPGLAYGTANAEHLLNVRAANMSAFPDAPGDFVLWLWRTDPSQSEGGPERGGAIPPSGHAFVARGVYGRYVSETLSVAAKEAAARGVELVMLGRDVADLRETDTAARLTLAGGGSLNVDSAVLCIGNFPPELPVSGAGHVESPRIVRDPWNQTDLDRIGPDEHVLIIGTGLTMADMLLALDERGHRGPVTALSRRGLLPTVHAPTVPGRMDLDAAPRTARGLMRWIRAAIAEGQPWRSVIDALRPATARIWRDLPQAERRRFLRHARPYWEVHRHRLAPQVDAAIRAAVESGRLTIQAGRILALDADGTGVRLTIRHRGGTLDRIDAHRLINCSGPQADYARSNDPLVRRLLDRGLVRPDPLGLGLEVDDDLALVGADGPSPRLYALGPATKGAFWEITAVPDIRSQVAAFAARLAGQS